MHWIAKVNTLLTSFLIYTLLLILYADVPLEYIAVFKQKKECIISMFHNMGLIREQ